MSARLLSSSGLSLSSKNLTRCALFAVALLKTGHASFATPSSARTDFLTSLRMSSTQVASTLTIVQVPCLDDNYGYLIHDAATGDTAVVDTPEAKPYEEEMTKRGWKLTHILNTHHHWDHTGSNLELKKNGVKVYGPQNEKDKIPGIDVCLSNDDKVEFGSTTASVIDVGGHTLGHVAYHFPSDNVVFVGDSLFVLGCGKMFEGTPPQFWNSLKRLRELPSETSVYCAHEYTMSNAKFAMSVEPNNPDLVARVEQIKDKRSRGEPTVPTSIGDEKKTNPFLRCDISSEIRKNVGVTDADTEADAFGKVRRAKDTFRG